MMVIDRIEGDVAVLEIDGRIVEVPVTTLPSGAREGDVLTFTLGAPADRAEAEARLRRLKSRTPQGPGSFDL